MTQSFAKKETGINRLSMASGFWTGSAQASPSSSHTLSALVKKWGLAPAQLCKTLTIPDDWPVPVPIFSQDLSTVSRKWSAGRHKSAGRSKWSRGSRRHWDVLFLRRCKGLELAGSGRHLQVEVARPVSGLRQWEVEVARPVSSFQPEEWFRRGAWSEARAAWSDHLGLFQTPALARNHRSQPGDDSQSCRRSIQGQPGNSGADTYGFLPFVNRSLLLSLRGLDERQKTRSQLRRPLPASAFLGSGTHCLVVVFVHGSWAA